MSLSPSPRGYSGAALDRLLRVFPNAKQKGSAWWACCPAHDDRSPSLEMSQPGHAAIYKCWANCSQEAVMAALLDLGIRPQDLFDDSPSSPARPPRELADAAKHAAARVDAGRILADSSPCTGHPYLTAKGIQPHGARLTRSGALLVAFRDVFGTLHTTQTIDLTREKPKLFQVGGKIAGNFVNVDDVDLSVANLICIGEGWATAVSVLEATGHAALSVGGKTNLISVARNVRARYPDVRLVLCADADAIPEATEAARAVGGFLAEPGLGVVGSKADFNDVHQSQGLEAVRVRIDAAKRVERAAGAGPLTETRVGSPPAGPKGAHIVCMSEMEGREVGWLWPQRIPLGMIALVDGADGVGKSSVILDLVARLTTARPWPASAPQRAEPRDVILIGHEDAPHETIRPRLDAAGADPSRVHLLLDIDGRLPSLPLDTAILEEAITSRRAVMVVVDPIAAYLGGVDTHRDAEVRGALAPLAAVAERTGCSVVLIRHLRKSGGVAAGDRGLGSVAFGALARAKLMLLQDPDDPLARILAWTKLTVGPRPASLRWRFGVAEGQCPPPVVWDDTPCDLSADEILDRADDRTRRAPAGSAVSAVSSAAECVRQVLSGGPMASAELERRVIAAGHSEPTYRRASREVGVRRVQRGRIWLSELPPGSDDLRAPNKKYDHLDQEDHLSPSGDPDDPGDHDLCPEGRDHLTDQDPARPSAAHAENGTRPGNGVPSNPMDFEAFE